MPGATRTTTGRISASRPPVTSRPSIGTRHIVDWLEKPRSPATSQTRALIVSDLTSNGVHALAGSAIPASRSLASRRVRLDQPPFSITRIAHSAAAREVATGRSTLTSGRFPPHGGVACYRPILFGRLTICTPQRRGRGTARRASTLHTLPCGRPLAVAVVPTMVSRPPTVATPSTLHPFGFGCTSFMVPPCLALSALGTQKFLDRR